MTFSHPSCRKISASSFVRGFCRIFTPSSNLVVLISLHVSFPFLKQTSVIVRGVSGRQTFSNYNRFGSRLMHLFLWVHQCFDRMQLRQLDTIFCLCRGVFCGSASRGRVFGSLSVNRGMILFLETGKIVVIGLLLNGAESGQVRFVRRYSIFPELCLISRIFLLRLKTAIGRWIEIYDRKSLLKLVFSHL